MEDASGQDQPISFDTRQRMLRFALALGIGLVSGLIASQTRLPIPWMLGPMIGTMVFAVAGAPVLSPMAMRPLVVPILGVMLGSGFKAETFANLGSWALTLALMPVYIACSGIVAYFYLRKIVRYDPVTAYFCAMPGGVNEMLLMGTRYGGDDRKIGLSHATRILIVVTTVVFSYALFLDVSVGNNRPFTTFSVFSLSDIAWLGGCGVIGALLGLAVRAPAALLTGPLVLSAAAHSMGFVHLPPPTLLQWGAQLVIGTIVGARFVGVSLREIARYLTVGIVAAMLILTVSGVFAAIVTIVSGIDISQSFLAFSPGGATEMSLLGLAMGQEIVFISFSHIVRVAMVVAIAPLGYRLFHRFFR